MRSEIFQSNISQILYSFFLLHKGVRTPRSESLRSPDKTSSCPIVFPYLGLSFQVPILRTKNLEARVFSSRHPTQASVSKSKSHPPFLRCPAQPVPSNQSPTQSSTTGGPRRVTPFSSRRRELRIERLLTSSQVYDTDGNILQAIDDLLLPGLDRKSVV